MKELNKKTDFDRYWEDVFQEAEMTPPDTVWGKIDTTLSKEEAGYFKRKAFMFKMLAAASIAFALGIGMFSMNYYLNNPNNNNIVQLEEGTNLSESPTYEDAGQVAMNDELVLAEDVGTSMENNDSEIEFTQSDNSSDDAVGSLSNLLSKSENSTQQITNGSAAVDSEAGQTITSELKGTDQSELIGRESNSETQELNTSLAELLPVGVEGGSESDLVLEIEHIYLIPFMPSGASKIKRESDMGSLMASLDFSTGQFDPNFQQGGSNFAVLAGGYAADARTELTSFNTTNKDFVKVRSSGQETQPEIAFSYGANVGFKLSKRILLQTGIAYRKANTTTTTTGYIENAGSNTRVPIVASYQYKLGGLSSVNRIDETKLNNQYEFASVPLRAGYIIVNRKVNLTLLAGISSEFFINNSIVDESDFLQTLSSDDASDSPYKSVYFNGSLGTMLGYTFARNYMITVEPSYRVAINSFTKDSFYLSSYPSSFMVSFGVAYNFK